MVFNATFHDISVILWRSVLLLEETGISEENHQPAASHWQTLLHNVVPRHEWGSNSQAHVIGIGTDCIGIYKSNYHTITSTTAPQNIT